MAREPVAVDYMGVGERGSAADGSEERVQRLVRPIPSVPDTRGGQSRRSPVPEGGRSLGDRDNHPFTQGLTGDFFSPLHSFVLSLDPTSSGLCILGGC